MKPRGDVVFLSGDLTLAEAVAVIVDQPYTRYPVTGHISVTVPQITRLSAARAASRRSRSVPWKELK